MRVKSLSRVRLFATPRTIAYQVPPSMGFSRQECWSGLSFPSPGDLPDPGIELGSPALQADALPSEPPGKLFVLSEYRFLHWKCVSLSVVSDSVTPHRLYSPPASWNPGGKGIARISLPGFPRQEFWSRLPFPSPGDLPDPGIEPGSPTLHADSLLSEPPGKPSLHWKWG